MIRRQMLSNVQVERLLWILAIATVPIFHVGQKQKGHLVSVKHAHAIEPKAVDAGTNVTMQVLISPEEGPHFAMRRFVIRPGGGMPNHTNLVEHEQYVLNGHARIGIGPDIFEVRPGDVVFIPAEVPHWYQNTGDEPFEFLCLVPNKPDAITILDA
jgi:quercetin dioxygenase-like cupin family protein